MCGYCHDDYVVPVWIEDLGEHGWHLLLRCGQCETYREVIVEDDTANAYDRELDRGGAQTGGPWRNWTAHGWRPRWKRSSSPCDVT